MRAAAPSPGWSRPVLYALALHTVVIAVLVVGFRFMRRDEPTYGPVMQATVVREPTPQVAAPEPQAERKRREAEAAEELQRKEKERVRLETERKQQDEALHQKQEAERKKQAADAEKKKHEAERTKEAKQRQQQAEQTLQEQLAEEEKSRQAARATRQSPEADRYRSAIRQKVSRQWVPSASSRKGLECTVRVRVLRGGEVSEAKVVRSSGDAAFDRSVETAVYKAAPLPVPEDAELFEQFREIEFIFRPESEPA